MCWDENERLAELLKRKGVPVVWMCGAIMLDTTGRGGGRCWRRIYNAGNNPAWRRNEEDWLVLFGMENTFPGALVEKINSMELEGIRAEFVHISTVKMAEPSGYAVIVDRISHDVPFYRAYLKNAALWRNADHQQPFLVECG